MTSWEDPSFFETVVDLSIYFDGAQFINILISFSGAHSAQCEKPALFESYHMRSKKAQPPPPPVKQNKTSGGSFEEQCSLPAKAPLSVSGLSLSASSFISLALPWSLAGVS